MTTLSELLTQHPRLPVEVYCSCKARLGRYPVRTHDGDYVEFAGLEVVMPLRRFSRATGEKKYGPTPTPAVPALPLYRPSPLTNEARYEWTCPLNPTHTPKRLLVRLGRTDASLGQESIRIAV